MKKFALVLSGLILFVLIFINSSNVALATGTSASDTFARTVSSGWGSANTGGSYTLTGTSANFNVASPDGKMSVTAAGSGGDLTAQLGSVTATSIDITTKIILDKVPTGNSAFIYLNGRHVSSGNEYRGRVRISSTKGVFLQGTSVTGGVETLLGAEVQTAGITYNATNVLDVHVQITGVNPTTINMRSWVDGNTEPSTWDYTTTDSTSALQTGGSVGIMSHLGSGTSNTPILFSYENYLVTNSDSFTISGTVYTDTNENGVQDGGETGYHGATVTLSGTSSGTTTTDVSGNYSFTGLNSGNYTVGVTLPNGYLSTTNNPVDIPLVANTTQNYGIAISGGSIFLRSFTTASDANTSSTFTIDTPQSISQGDVLVAQITASKSATITPPASWTLIESDTSTSTLQLASYYHVATASSPSNYSWTFEAPYYSNGGIAAYSGVNTNTPINANGGQTNGNNNNVIAPSITTTVANTQLLFLSSITSNTSVNVPSGFTKHWDLNNGGSTGKTSTMADRSWSATGATGSFTGTEATTSAFTNIAQLIALNPNLTLTGTVYTDTNQNGVQDNGEAGYQGATVSISGPANSSTTTNSSGVYSFSNLAAGTYVVKVTLPNNYQSTTNNPTDTPISANTTQNFGIIPSSGSIILRSFTTNSASATSMTIDTPSGIALNDVLVAQITATKSATITQPTNWNLIEDDTSSSTLQMASYYYVATSSSPSNFTWNFSGTTKVSGGIADFIGVNTTTPVNVHSGQVNGTKNSVTAPSIVTTSANTELLFLAGVAANVSVNAPSGYQLDWNVNNLPSSSGRNSMFANKFNSAVGATGSVVGTEATTSAYTNIAQSIALNPAVIPTPNPTPTPAPVTHLPFFAHYYIWWDANHWLSKLGANYPYSANPLPLPAVLDADGCTATASYAGDTLIDIPNTVLNLYSQDDLSTLDTHIQEAANEGLSGFVISWAGNGKTTQTATSTAFNRRLDNMVKRITAYNNNHSTKFYLIMGYEGLNNARAARANAWVINDLTYFNNNYANNDVFKIPQYGTKPVVMLLDSRLFAVSDLAAITTPFASNFLWIGDEHGKTEWSRGSSQYFNGDGWYFSSQNPYTNPASFSQVQNLATQIHSEGKTWFAPFNGGYNKSNFNIGGKCIPRNNGQTMRLVYQGNSLSNPDGWMYVSWNEFFENTYVEPSLLYGSTMTDTLGAIIASSSATPTPSPVGTTLTLNGVVYLDTNSNGVQDDTENGYPGATVTLSGDASATTTTDSNGNYSFANLNSGNYTVTLTVPSGYVNTTSTSATIPLTDSTSQNFGIDDTTPTVNSLTQYKSDGTTVIDSGGWTNENSVKLSFTMSSSNSNDTLIPQIEIKPNNVAFTNSVTNTGTSVAYSGSLVTGTVTVTGLTDGVTYHWQARITGNSGAGAWVSMGGTPDFGVDLGTPTAPVSPVTTTPTTSGTQTWTWGASTATSGIGTYVYRVVDINNQPVTDGTSDDVTTDTNLSAGVYTFYVKAVSLSGNTGPESSGTVEVKNGGSSQDTGFASCSDQTPYKPDLFQINAYKTNAVLYYAPPPFYDSFMVDYSRKPDVWEYSTRYSQALSKGVLSYSINSLAPDTVYYFRIRTGSGCAVSPQSNVMKIKTTNSIGLKKIYYKNVFVNFAQSFKSAFQNIGSFISGQNPTPAPESQPEVIQTETPPPVINVSPTSVPFRIFNTPAPVVQQSKKFCLLWWCFEI